MPGNNFGDVQVYLRPDFDTSDNGQADICVIEYLSSPKHISGSINLVVLSTPQHYRLKDIIKDMLMETAYY